MTRSALDVIRPMVRLGSAVAPALTARAAFELFCRTRQPGGVDEKQRAMIERAERRMSEADAIETPFAGGAVTTYSFAPHGEEKGAVMLVHGWTGRAAFMSAFVEPLRQAGYRALAIDLPGHGRSSGRVLHMPRAIAALHAVLDRTGPWHGVIGHSFGGAVATTLAAGGVEGFPQVKLARLALIAAPESMPALFRQFGGFVGLGPRAQARYEGRVRTLSGRELESFRGAAHLREAGTPTLVLHAPDDREVPFSEAEALASAGPFVRLQPMPGLGHRRILYAPPAVAAAVAHVTGAEAAGLAEDAA